MKKIITLRSVIMVHAIILFMASISFGQASMPAASSNENITPSSSINQNSNSSQSRISNSPSVNSVSDASFLRYTSSCATPAGVASTVLSSTSATLNWTAQTGIMYYNFRYRIVGASSWTYDSTITNSKRINGLTSATTYEYQAQTRCTAGILSVYGTKYTFTTLAATTSCENIKIIRLTRMFDTI